MPSTQPFPSVQARHQGGFDKAAPPSRELMAKLQALTNLQVIEDKAAATGHKLEVGPFPGWKDVPTW